MGSCGGFEVKLREIGFLRWFWGETEVKWGSEMIWVESEENWGPEVVLG